MLCPAQSLKDPGWWRLHPLGAATLGTEVAMVATAGDERSEGHTLAPKCFRLERSHVTFIYSLLARTGDMALLEGKAPGTEQETCGLCDIPITVPE